jgi:hypothetical protein
MGRYEKAIDAAWKSIDTNAFARFKCNQEMDSCADFVYLVPGSHLMRGMRGTRTTKDKLSTGRLPRLFYVPYLNIGLDLSDVRFALLELHSLRLLLSRTRTEEEHDRFLSNNSKSFVTFATINMLQHPSGFRICVLHGEDSSKANQADAPVYSTTHSAIHVISLQEYPPIQKQTSHLNWLCLFRSYPCTRDSLLELDQADLTLHSFKKGFGSCNCTLTLG